MRKRLPVVLTVSVAVSLTWTHSVCAGDLTVDLGKTPEVALVGAVARWDDDGNHRRRVDTKAKIDAPYVDARAEADSSGKWTFKGLAPGKYDLVILTKDRLRLEGFDFPPVKEFDPTFAGSASTDEETRQTILDDIAGSPHYENVVAPLYLGGDKKAVRVLVMLIRDKPTSYEADFARAATIRHEIWQYSLNYGVWQKEKRTKVVDRLLLDREELHRWTWLWDAKLGGIALGSQPLEVKYPWPDAAVLRNLKGLHPR